VWLVSYVLADCKFMTVSSLPFGAGVVEEIEREWWSPPPEVVAGELTAERLAAHDGHRFRVLHENASGYSLEHSGHRIRAKPFSKSPQSR
jgi:hypothetical protein